MHTYIHCTYMYIHHWYSESLYLVERACEERTPFVLFLLPGKLGMKRTILTIIVLYDVVVRSCISRNTTAAAKRKRKIEK